VSAQLKLPFSVTAVSTRPSQVTQASALNLHGLLSSADNASRAPPIASTHTASRLPVSCPMARPLHYTTPHRGPEPAVELVPCLYPVLGSGLHSASPERSCYHQWRIQWIPRATTGRPHCSLSPVCLEPEMSR